MRGFSAFSEVANENVNVATEMERAILIITHKIRDGVEIKRNVDNGTGVSEEVLSRVKEPFYSKNGLWQATGLGLTTVNNIVNDLNGEMNINSTPEKGTE